MESGGACFCFLLLLGRLYIWGLARFLLPAGIISTVTVAPVSKNVYLKKIRWLRFTNKKTSI